MDRCNDSGTPYIARLMAGLLKPKRKVLGTDVAGQVEAVGETLHSSNPVMKSLG